MQNHLSFLRGVHVTWLLSQKGWVHKQRLEPRASKWASLSNLSHLLGKSCWNKEHLIWNGIFGAESYSNSFNKYRLFGNFSLPRLAPLTSSWAAISSAFQNETEDSRDPSTYKLVKAVSCDPILSARISNYVKGYSTTNIFKRKRTNYSLSKCLSNIHTKL